MAMTMTKMKANTATLWSLFIMMPLLTSQIFSWWCCTYRYIYQYAIKEQLLSTPLFACFQLFMMLPFHNGAVFISRYIIALLKLAIIVDATVLHVFYSSPRIRGSIIRGSRPAYVQNLRLFGVDILNCPSY